jgi:hypothetical protein
MEFGYKTSNQPMAAATALYLDFMLERLWNMGYGSIPDYSKSK